MESSPSGTESVATSMLCKWAVIGNSRLIALILVNGSTSPGGYVSGVTMQSRADHSGTMLRNSVNGCTVLATFTSSKCSDLFNVQVSVLKKILFFCHIHSAHPSWQASVSLSQYSPVSSQHWRYSIYRQKMGCACANLQCKLDDDIIGGQ